MVNTIFQRLIDSVFPFHCLLCAQVTGLNLPICPACLPTLPHNTRSCPSCALPLARPAAACGLCLRQAPPFSRCVAPLLYEGPVVGFIHQLKYHSNLTAIPLLATLLARAVATAFAETKLPPPDLLVPMPQHWRRTLQRGYNQSDRLAQALLKTPELKTPELEELQLTHMPRLCRRIRHTPTQTGLTRQQRDQNLRNAFAVNQSLGGKRVAIVDDVVTTGASSSALARSLLDAGAADVQLWCCARTP